MAQAYDLKGTVVAAELDLGVLTQASAEVLMFRDLLAFPAVEQDLALVVDAAVPASAVVESLRKAGGKLLEDVRVFDLYEGRAGGRGQEEPGSSPELPRAGPHSERGRGQQAPRRRCSSKIRAELGAELRG